MLRMVIIMCVALLLGVVITDDGCGDEIRNDYMIRAIRYRSEINQKATDVKIAFTRTRKQEKLEEIDKQSYGRVTRETREDNYQQKNQRVLAEKAFEDLGKEINNFKSEILKHYKGKPPKDLYQQVKDTISYYQKSRKEINDDINKQLRPE